MTRRVIATEAILDAARDATALGGVRGATLEMIAAASDVPVGSIYYRFGSIQELIARAWLRSVHRSHEAASSALQAQGRDAEGLVAAALASYDFCLGSRNDAALLASLRAADVRRWELPADLREEIEAVNDPAEGEILALARGCFGRADRGSRDLVLLAIVDLPYGAALRHLQEGGSAPARRRQALGRAVQALVPGSPV
jgi:AcrR family transcriptional regulator